MNDLVLNDGNKPYSVLLGDCGEVLKRFPDNSFDSIVCDPPYGLSKEPDMTEVLRHWLAGDDYKETGGGFMGKTWDGFVPGPPVWSECFRVLKPGGHLLSFFGSRTYDMGTLAIRLAGFEIRDQIMWVYGSGFPKSKNLNEQWQGWGTALKPAHEPIVVARKPLEGTVAENVLKWGTGALNIDGCRVEPTGESRARISEPSQERRYTENGGTNFAAKPGIRGGDPQGRWPANVIHDGSDEVLESFPEASGAVAAVRGTEASRKTNNTFGEFGGRVPSDRRDGGGSAARFFYCAKASKRDRDEGLDEFPEVKGHSNYGSIQEFSSNPPRRNHHPTVKPTALMRYLVRLVTPPGGVVLDPFLGSGSTGKAAMLEGFRFVGIDMTPEYVEIAQARIRHAAEQAQEPAASQLALFDAPQRGAA